ncbi:tetratricopeptide repeat protein [Mucilaginibacter sp. BT774]|uniref:tetratricopeptide repeat protein n=1 Tax=Mucilaginibacter sp. BT774 TaxID=3062276 RepID=UPI00267706D9|nr:tetratricopeptide repeat protein [Mucilaginibacter sp. BT774]MDO3627114.1 tetratricopeptide repeat protein [Mucilaginibacter sp. BT774]
MNRLYKNLVTLALTIISLNASAQDKGSVSDLIKEGVQLNDQGKYTEAIAKYDEALKLEPENAQANYEMAFTLVQSGKGNDGIPYIDKAIEKSNSPQLKAACYDMLGSIYDNAHQPQKAIEAYKSGIQINPQYQRLYYNLGLTYFRNKQFAEAEANAIEAIKLDPKHASSLRMYALVTFHQNKRANALMGFCSFLLLNPQSPQAAEAFGNIQHILQGGVLKDVNGKNTILLSPKGDKENESMNLAISMSVLTGQNKKLTGMELLEYELKSIFTIAGELSEKKTDKGFYDKFFVDYFYNLAKSDNMAAFARLVSLSANKEANSKWMNEHEEQVKALDGWLANRPREF